MSIVATEQWVAAPLETRAGTVEVRLGNGKWRKVYLHGRALERFAVGERVRVANSTREPEELWDWGRVAGCTSTGEKLVVALDSYPWDRRVTPELVHKVTP